MNAYEVTYILNPGMSDDGVKDKTDKYSEQVTTLGGQVVNVDIWGKKRLAYEINGKFDGNYICMKFNSPADAEAELRRLMRIDEEVIRSLFIRLDPK